MTTLSDIQRGALGLATTDSPTFNGLSIDTTAGVDGQWDTTGLTVYANAVTPQHDGPLHVMEGTAGTISANADANTLVLEAASATGMTFLVPDSGVARIRMTNPTDGNQGGLLLAWDDSVAMASLQTATASAKLGFYTGAQQFSGEWNTTGLTCFASGVTPQHDTVLHVMGASAGSVSSISGSVATFEGGSTTYVNILSPDANSGLYNFGNPSNNNAAYLAWNYSGSLMTLATNKAGASIKFATAAGVDALTLDSSQRAVFVGQIRGAAGSAATPQYSYSGSTGTGDYMVDVGGGTINLSASIIGVQASKYSSAGAAITFTRYTVTADDATGSPLQWESSSGGQGGLYASTTTSITTAKEIMDVGTDRTSALIMVTGSANSSTYFSDLIHFQNGVTVVNARTTGASARTYSLVSQGHVNVAMASGTYVVIANALRTPTWH